MNNLLKPDLILYSITAFFLCFFLWAAFSELEEVTVGHGKVIATSKVQVVQNLEGGIVNNIAVKTGEKVIEGQLLIKLDDTRFIGDLKSAQQNAVSLKKTIELLKEEMEIQVPLVDKGGAPYIELVRLKQKINTRESELTSLLLQIPTLEDKVARTEVVAPKDGIINRLLINTEGGVVQPGSPLLEMIPVDDELIVEVEISPTDIAYVSEGLKTIVQLSSFDYSLYGSLEGKVLTVGADTLIKEDGTTWYLCLISIPSDRKTTMSKQIEVLPGMQATVNIVSGSKSVLQYLLQPFTDIKNKAFRER